MRKVTGTENLVSPIGPTVNVYSTINGVWKPHNQCISYYSTLLNISTDFTQWFCWDETIVNKLKQLNVILQN